MKHLFTVFVLANLIFTITSNVFAANLDLGEQIFISNCAACHNQGNNVIMPEKTLKIDTLEENSMNSVSAITNQVKNGKNAMPAFGGRLTDEDIDNVANYVLNKAEQGW